MTVTDSVRAAVEADTEIESHLHPQGSFEPDFFAVPTGREEIWRFTPLKRLRDLHGAADLTSGQVEVSAKGASSDVGVEVVGADSGLRGTSGIIPRDRIAARAWQAASNTYVVDIAADTTPDPITVGVTGSNAELPAAAHLVIRAQKFARATVIVHYTGSATLAENVEIIADDGANLTVVTVQDWTDDAVHVSNQHAKIGRDASLKHIAISIGGDVVRHDFSTQYDGPGGSVDAFGLYFADGGDGAGQHIEHRLLIDHTAPKTKSNVAYKGALQGAGAHTVWIGNILIRKVAEGIETYEENRNLVLTDGCQADSVPNLEIETGEIEGAGHASTVGRFDDNQLFYLQSRGVSAEDARRLVVHGFFNDIIRRIGVPELQDKLVAVVEAELAEHIGTATQLPEQGGQ